MDSKVLEAFKYLLDRIVSLYRKERGSKLGILNLAGGLLYGLWLICYSLLNEFKRLFFWFLNFWFEFGYTPVSAWQYFLFALVIPLYFLGSVYFVHDKIPD